MRFFNLFLIVFAVGWFAVSANQLNEESYSFELPADWSSVRSTIDTSFSCEGRSYGYYADVANDCQLYHVCNPREENGQIVYSQTPFICPLGTVFSQEHLTCVHFTNEFSCAESVKYYGETENRYADVPVNVVNSPVEDAPVRNVPSEESAEVTEHSEVVHPVENVATRSTQNHVVLTQPKKTINLAKTIQAPVKQIVQEVEAPVKKIVQEVQAPVSVKKAPVFSPVEKPVVVSNNLPMEAPVSPPVNSEVARSNVVNDHHSSEHSEVMYNHPILTRSTQNNVALTQPRKEISKSVQQQTQQVEQPTKTIQAPVKQIVQAPAPVKQVVQAPAPVKQVVQAPVKQVVQAPVPVKQVVQAPAPVKQTVQAPAPVKQVVQAPVKQVVQAPVPVKQVVQAPAPVKQVAQAPVPVKQVVQAPAPVKQVVQAPVPVKQIVQAPVRQQQTQQVEPMNVAKTIQAPVKQIVQAPRKSNGPVKQELMKAQYNFFNNNYNKLLPRLISNNPYHVRVY